MPPADPSIAARRRIKVTRGWMLGTFREAATALLPAPEYTAVSIGVGGGGRCGFPAITLTLDGNASPSLRSPVGCGALNLHRAFLPFDGFGTVLVLLSWEQELRLRENRVTRNG